MIGVIISKGQEYIYSCCTEIGFCLTIHIAASSVCRAICTVTANGEHTAVIQPRKGRSRSKSQFLISSTQTFSS